MLRAACIAALVVVVACGDETAVCADANHLRVCDGDDCSDVACRGDELCVVNVCRPWQQTELSVDFDISYDPGNARRIIVQVAKGGFPRHLVEQLRFSFGDDYSGWGEYVTHRYAAPGVYPVELVVRLHGYVLLRASRLAVIEPSADWNPLFVTVNEIPDYLNGSRPFHSNNDTLSDTTDDYDAAFHLYLPRHGFDIDLSLLVVPGAEVDLNTLMLTADVDLGNGAVLAGTNLADRLVFVSDPVERASKARWHVGTTDALPLGMMTFTLLADTLDGASHSVTSTIEAVELTAALDPFDRPMTWLLRFDMDLYTTTATTYATGAIALDSVQGANGIDDFEEELRLVGAQGNESASGAAAVRGRGHLGANAIYRAWVEREIVVELNRFFGIAPDGTPHDGIALQIIADSQAGAPEAADFRVDGEFSMMRFGGAFVGFLGRSWFSIYNEDRIDDTDVGLGVGTASLINVLSTVPGVTEELDPIKPATGTPVGEHALDAVILADSFDRWALDNDSAANARWDALAAIAGYIALTIANVGAHEMGHAMGLMPDGPPPDGYFGGRADIDFIGSEFTNSHHVDFPPINLMQAGGNPIAVIVSAMERVEVPRSYGMVELLEVFGRENRLSPLSRAYLQARLTYRSFNKRDGVSGPVDCR